MEQATIVIEERLDTRRLLGALGAATALLPLFRPHRPINRFRTLVTGVILAGTAAMLSRVVARVVETPDGRSFELVYGPGGLVRQVFRPDEIESVGATTVSVVRSGGWGYRGSLRLLGRASVVTRGGDAIRVYLAGGRRLTVTVDEATAFARALGADR